MATRQAVKASLASLGIKKIDSAAGIDEYRMRNGLKILLRENHSAPVVSFMLVYRVGSRNEAVGHTGSTHFLEHMMFKGTKKFNPASGSGVMETFSRVGALLNATTWLDRTNYYECVPSEYLQLCIQVEADRMRNLNLRQEDRDSEMTVVRNEFERGENNPGSALSKELTALAFREHPYHHPTIGWRTDVEYVPLERLKEFYDTYYWPDNATAIVVGDFDSDKTLRMIEKYFGKIPKSPRPIPQVYTVEPPQEGERRVELRRAGDLPQLIMGYHTPQADHRDTYALSVMQSVLGDSGKRSSRLYKALVEQGLATSCYASNGEFRDPFLFTLGATLAPGKTFEEVESVIYAEIDRLTKEDCSEEELYRIKQSNRKGTILSNADPQSFANMICASESVATWRWLVEYDDNVDAVTPADIRRVASTYFDKTNRTVAHFIPSDTERPRMEFGNPNNGKQQQKQKAAAKVEQKRIDLPKPGSSGSNFAQRVHKEVLPNGMTILVLPNPGTGSVAIHGALAGGDCFASSDRTMTPTVTSTMLTRGSQNYTKEQLAHILEEMGIRFGFGADRYKVGFGTLVTKEDFPRFIPVLDDLLRRPQFNRDELAIVLKELKAGLTRSMNDTGRRAANALMQLLYPAGHPFHERSHEERIAELEHINHDELASFHRSHYSPAGTVLAVVGDIDVDLALSQIKDRFSDWQGPLVRPAEATIVPMPSQARRVEINLADKANADIYIGHPTSLSRKDKDFFAAQLANAALGKDTISSRLGKVVRVKHGLSYGIYSYFDDTSFGAAPWMISMSVNPDKISEAIRLVDEVVSTYKKKGITATELEDEAGRAVGSFLVSLRSSDGIASALARFEYLGLGIESMDTISDSFMSVKRKDVLEAIEKYLHPEIATTVIAGTVSRFE